MEHVFGALGDHGVAGVVAARVTGDDVGFGGEAVDDLALAFVSPLLLENQMSPTILGNHFQKNFPDGSSEMRRLVGLGRH